MEAVLIASFDPSEKALVETIQRSLEEIGVSFRAPRFEAGALWADAITDAITSADLVIADVSRGNPNVFYELGYAHALRKNTILLVNRDARANVAFDLAGTQYLIYDPQDLRELRIYLQHRVSYLKHRREALA